MKKIYTAAMLAAMSLSATAADFVPVSPQTPGMGKKEFKLASPETEPNSDVLSKLVRTGIKPANGTRSEAIGEDIVGNYCITYTDTWHEFEDGTPVIFNSVGYIEEGFAINEYTMSFPFLYVTQSEENIYLMQFPIYVDGNKVSFKSESYAVEGGTLQLQVFHEIYNSTSSSYEYEKVDVMEAEFSGSGFNFGKDYIFTIYDEAANYQYFIAYFSTFQKYDATSSVFNIGWKSLGTGVFQDGWLLSNATQGQQNQWCYEVEIQQSEIDENVYRIVNPYGTGTPMASQNDAATAMGSIQFNMEDVDHVYFQAVPTNFVSDVVGMSQMFVSNNLSIYVEGYGFDIDYAVDMLESNGYGLWSNFKDGVLTVPSVYDAATDSYINDALFSAPEMGIGVAPYYGYNWSGSNELPLNMECKLFFPGVFEAGVEGIEADSNTPVKYYNLQGVEVVNPVKGQLLIKRQGGKAEKIVF